MSKLSSPLFCVLLACTWGCGDDDPEPDAAAVVDATSPDAAVPDATPAFECTAANSLCVTLTVPETFTGTPRNVSATYYTSWPPMGAPTGVLYTMDSPVIDADTPFELRVEDYGASGEQYFYVVLFMEGGGTFQPTEGVDYHAVVMPAVDFDGSAINLPDLQLELYAAPTPP